MAHIFVSHRSPDLVEATKLAEELKDAGHEVWLDLWEIGVGDSIVERMDVGLSNAEYVVVCLSSADPRAPWMGREWMSALARQLGGTGVKLLPVLMPGGAPPAILADIQYADLSTDWNKGVQALLRAIR